MRARPTQTRRWTRNSTSIFAFVLLSAIAAAVVTVWICHLQTQIHAPVQKQALTAVAASGVLIISSVCGLFLIWLRRERNFELQEIEARKQAEESLRQTVARVHGFMSAAFEGICFHADGRIVDANEQYAKKLGYNREELIGKPVLDLVVPQHRHLVVQNLTSGSEECYEHLALRKDGSTFAAEVRGKWVSWEGRQIKVAALRDISERRRMQEALQSRIVALTQPMVSSADITFKDLFDLEEIQRVQDTFSRVARVGSLITTPEGIALTRPSNFCRLCSEIIRNTEKGRANCMKSDACIGKQNPNGPIVQACLSGGLLDAGASITVGGKHIANWLVGQVRTEDQDEEKMLQYAREIGADVEEFRAALRDVPVMSLERFKHIAEAIYVLANELSLRAFQNCQQARFIAERQEAEADRERLLRELVRKNKELESVIYISSHDLRSPLVNIQGFSHRLKTGCDQMKGILADPDVPPRIVEAAKPILNDRVGPALGFISSSVTKMDGLLNGLLRLSRLGRASLNCERLDMNKLARTAAESLAFQVQQTNAVVIVNDLPPCYGDATQISQVLSNLLDNALKYRDPARSLYIRIHGEERGGECIYTVEDSGLGIQKEQQDKVWEIFHRLRPDGAIKGEGLGLSIVRRILDRHEGRAWLDSEPGQGSRFSFALPATFTESGSSGSAPSEKALLT